VALFYNPRYSGGRDQEDAGSRPALTNSGTLSQQLLGVVVHTCHSNYSGSVNMRKGSRLAQVLSKNIFGKLLKQKGWGHGSSGRTPVRQAQGSKFNPQYHQKTKRLPL
jgi:hypothetical protein